MLTLIKVKVKLQPTVNCGDTISTILFKQRACRRKNTPAVDISSAQQQEDNDWFKWAKQICERKQEKCYSALVSIASFSVYIHSAKGQFISINAFTCGLE